MYLAEEKDHVCWDAKRTKLYGDKLEDAKYAPIQNLQLSMQLNQF